MQINGINTNLNNMSFQSKRLEAKGGIREIPIPENMIDGMKEVISGGNKGLIACMRKMCGDLYRQAKFEIDFERQKEALTKGLSSKNAETRKDTVIKILTLKAKANLVSQGKSKVVDQYIADNVIPLLSNDKALTEYIKKI